MSSSNLKIDQLQENIYQIELFGNIHGGNEAMDFTSALLELSGNSLQCVIVNLKNVELINSSGLGMLVSGLTTLKRKNIDLVLVSVPEKIDQLLTMTHLNQIFKMYDSTDQALIDYK